MHLRFLFLLGFVSCPSIDARFSSSASAMFGPFPCPMATRQNSPRTSHVQPSSSIFFSRRSRTPASVSPWQNDTMTPLSRPRRGIRVQTWSTEEKYSARDRPFCSKSGQVWSVGNGCCSGVKSRSTDSKNGCSLSSSVTPCSDTGWADGGTDSSRGTESGTTRSGSSPRVTLPGPPVDAHSSIRRTLRSAEIECSKL
ncbi:hypothetical protein VTN02DRAFT_4271 [Thermoascus thermophilus]